MVSFSVIFYTFILLQPVSEVWLKYENIDKKHELHSVNNESIKIIESNKVQNTRVQHINIKIAHKKTLTEINITKKTIKQPNKHSKNKIETCKLKTKADTDTKITIKYKKSIIKNKEKICPLLSEKRGSSLPFVQLKL